MRGRCRQRPRPGGGGVADTAAINDQPLPPIAEFKAHQPGMLLLALVPSAFAAFKDEQGAARFQPFEAALRKTVRRAARRIGQAEDIIAISFRQCQAAIEEGEAAIPMLEKANGGRQPVNGVIDGHGHHLIGRHQCIANADKIAEEGEVAFGVAADMTSIREHDTAELRLHLGKVFGRAFRHIGKGERSIEQGLPCGDAILPPRLCPRQPAKVDILAAERAQKGIIEIITVLFQQEIIVAEPGGQAAGENLLVPEIGMIGIKFFNPGENEGAGVAFRRVAPVGGEIAQPGKFMQFPVPGQGHPLNPPGILVILLMDGSGKFKMSLKDVVGPLGIAGKDIGRCQIKPFWHPAFQKRLIGPARIDDIGNKSPRREAFFRRHDRGFVHFRPSTALMLAAYCSAPPLKTALPATSISAPASITSGAVSALMPPSTSRSISRPDVSII